MGNDSSSNVLSDRSEVLENGSGKTLLDDPRTALEFHLAVTIGIFVPMAIFFTALSVVHFSPVVAWTLIPLASIFTILSIVEILHIVRAALLVRSLNRRLSAAEGSERLSGHNGTEQSPTASLPPRAENNGPEQRGNPSELGRHCSHPDRGPESFGGDIPAAAASSATEADRPIVSADSFTPELRPVSAVSGPADDSPSVTPTQVCAGFENVSPSGNATQAAPARTIASSGVEVSSLCNKAKGHEKLSNDLTLKLIPVQEASERFTLKGLEFLHGKFTQERRGMMGLPRFVWFDMQQKHCLIADKGLFSVQSDALHQQLHATPERNGPELLPKVQPSFLQVERINRTPGQESYEISEYHKKFPSGWQHNITHDKLLDRSVVVETMLGLHLQDERLLGFARDLLSGYISTHRTLLAQYASKQMGLDFFTTPHVIEIIELFFTRSCGALGFARDLIKYSEAFNAVIAENKKFSLLQEEYIFLISCKLIVEKVTQQDSALKMKFEQCTTTSDDEIFCMLYGLTSPYVHFLNHKLDCPDFLHSSNGPNLLAYFLVDADFREALVAQTMKWAWSAINQYVTTYNTDTYDMLLSKASTQNYDHNCSFLPVVCKAIPGLVETIVYILLALKYGEKLAKIERDNPDFRHMRYILNFDGYKFTIPRGGLSAENMDLLLKVLNSSVPRSVRILLLARATAMIAELSAGTASFDHCISEIVNEYLEYEGRGFHLSPKECTEQLFQVLERLLRQSRDGDHAWSAFEDDIQEWIMYAIALTVRELVSDSPSFVQFEEIALSAGRRVGVLLAMNGSQIYERVQNSVLCNDISEQHLIPAHIMDDINVSSKSQRLSGI
ncbi:MAG: hypothetical protein ACTJLL_02030 [Anaplasma sp.]